MGKVGRIGVLAGPIQAPGPFVWHSWYVQFIIYINPSVCVCVFYFQTIINHCFKLHAFVIAVLIKYRLWNHLQFRCETQNLAVTLGETCVCIHKLVACTLNEAYSPLSLQLTRSLYSLDCILLYFIVLRVRTLTRVTKTWWDERTDGGGGGLSAQFTSFRQDAQAEGDWKH